MSKKSDLEEKKTISVNLSKRHTEMLKEMSELSHLSVSRVTEILLENGLENPLEWAGARMAGRITKLRDKYFPRDEDSSGLVG